MENKYKNLLRTEKDSRFISQLRRDINAGFADSIALVCRGEHMKNDSDFRKQLCAVLQFPYYYSGVYASLIECMCDLEWIPKKRVFVFIYDSNYISVDGLYDHFELFQRSTEEVAAYSGEFGCLAKNVYYIFQNTNKDFPLFESKELSEYK